MKKAFLLLGTAAMLAFIGCNNEPKSTEVTDTTPQPSISDTATAQPAETAAKPMDSAAMMKAMQDFATPGEAHKAMAAMNGKWKTDNTMWMAADKPPMKSSGTAEFKMIMGGRYQQSSYKGDMMGMPFEGTGMMAYNNGTKKYTNTWIDNMGTGIMIMEGTWDDASKSYTLKGNMYDPGAGKNVDCREVIKMTDDKNMTMEMYCPGADGKEMKTMELKYTKI